MPPAPKPVAKKKKHKKKSPSEYQELVLSLDDLVKRIVHIRDNDTCVICGSTARPQAGHLFVRDRKKTRWALHNVNIQCARCNLLHRFDQAPYIHWFIEKYGLEAYNELYSDAEGEPYYKWATADLRALREELDNVLKKLLLDRPYPPAS
jgi:hypothetical protein